MFRLAEKKNFFLCSKKEKNKTIFSPHLDSNSRSLKSFSRARAERALPPRATMASNPPRAPPLPPLPLPPPGHNPCFFTYDLPTPTTSIDAILDFLSTNHKPSSDLVRRAILLGRPPARATPAGDPSRFKKLEGWVFFIQSPIGL